MKTLIALMALILIMIGIVVTILLIRSDVMDAQKFAGILFLWVIIFGIVSKVGGAL